MHTNIDLVRLAEPQVREAERILKTCVHCGMCLATCPTYLLLGDERDSPRGRIYLIKGMLERPEAPDATTVRHIDRCLSCLSCMTTCPSGVNYKHLVDHARSRIETTHRRRLDDRLTRRFLAWVLPSPWRFRLALIGALVVRPLAWMLPGKLRSMVSLAPGTLPSPSWSDLPGVHGAEAEQRMRVALLTGCAQKVLAPRINEATIRLLTRLGCEVVVAPGTVCCGALQHHMGRVADARDAARSNIAAWESAGPVDAVVSNASGCGTQLKEYGELLGHDPEWAERARSLGERARDVSEVIDQLLTGCLPVPDAPEIAYHAACSLQHGQGISDAPAELLRRAGFVVKDIPEGHICCGSAGTYNLLQDELSGRLLERKCGNIEKTGAGAVAAGNIGCMVQIARGTKLPVVHPVELLDWATGGPEPPPFEQMRVLARHPVGATLWR